MEPQQDKAAFEVSLFLAFQHAYNKAYTYTLFSTSKSLAIALSVLSNHRAILFINFTVILGSIQYEKFKIKQSMQ